MKKLLYRQRADTPHWVGDGFPARSVFTYNDLAREISPFLLLDYAGPAQFKPSPDHRRGVGEHPHRGFETVTIVYDGQVEHRDSAGGGGVIGSGDVQWMTAAGGLVHEEFHGADFSKNGGAFEMAQLWVNLPAKNKMDPPRYQGITSAQIPEVAVGDSRVRVVAGEFAGAKGPALTFSPIRVLDVRLNGKVEIPVPKGWTTSVVGFGGGITLGSGEVVGDAEVVVLDREGASFTLEGQGTKALVLLGEPLNEPIVGHGPFVMNTPDELRQAFLDFQMGRMGRL